MNKRTLLMILDGWGIATKPEVSAIDRAQTPFVDSLYHTYANSQLEASGLAVGLPEGQMGNSEVGHMNIGAGRVVYQDLVKINMAIANREIADNPEWKALISYCLNENKPLHLMGLLSDGGVHSHINHLKGLVTLAHEAGIKELFVHVFTDGRDTDPQGGIDYLNDLENHLIEAGGQVASITGRYYAMDRDKRWARVKLAYDALVHGMGEKSGNLEASLQASYAAGVTDEFIKPIIQVTDSGDPVAVIQPGDAVCCFNFQNR